MYVCLLPLLLLTSSCKLQREPPCVCVSVRVSFWQQAASASERGSAVKESTTQESSSAIAVCVCVCVRVSIPIPFRANSWAGDATVLFYAAQFNLISLDLSLSLTSAGSSAYSSLACRWEREHLPPVLCVSLCYQSMPFGVKKRATKRRWTFCN